MSLKIATWNINSVRLRAELVEKYLLSHTPDVLCLQETKCRDSEFPAGVFRKLGYEHLAINGQKGYHGVAIASRVPFISVDKREFCAKGDARHVGVKIAADAPAGADIEIHNFYVPAGGDEPNPAINPKFAHKLAFLDEMADWFASEGIGSRPAVLVGDLNIAPHETDVWNHKALLSVVSHTPVEVERLAKVQLSGGWVDAVRKAVPHPEKLFTWWSYRSPNWAVADKGRRLDHVWVSECLAAAIETVSVHKDARGWERPSDHVPVMINLRDREPAELAQVG